MKKAFTFLFVILSLLTFGQQWVAIKSEAPSHIQTTLVSSSENSIIVNLQVPGFYAFEVSTPRGEANVVSVPRTVSTAAAGEPDLPMIAIPALIGDHQHYNVRVIEAQFADFSMDVAPSKGDFSRQIDPADVPYTYGEAYSTDAFFPAQNVDLYEPYILRDFRGQNMAVYPFAYNPISKTLRVYYNMTVEMFSDGPQGESPIVRRSNVLKMDPEFAALYRNHFVNYNESMDRYTPVDETGELLIICHDAFMSAMQPFVNWKKQIGRPTTMVGTSTTGTTYSSIKTYIQNQYNANSNLTHVLLVGDAAQIPGYPYSAGSYGGKSDNMYGQVAGNDLYNDIIIGRFSAENQTQVTTQVNKVIHYERDINASDTWLTKGGGVAAYAGNSGHFGEDDWQHINNIRTDLLGYNYTTVYQDYQNVSGYSSSAAIMSQHYNAGVSIINYCNHGSETSWGVFSYSNSHVNALTNDNKLPIIWSVACLVGKYDYSQPCFGETWMRATNNSNGAPTGAIGGMFSYISQPWQPPMYGQDEMVDVLVESYNSNIKRTLGGTSYDGNMKILDQYGQSNNPAKGTYLAWILYGDPTLTLRNAIPTSMGVTHDSSMTTTATSFTVNATNGNGALATLTRDNEIMGTATISNGTCNITFAAPVTTGTATLTVFGYNKITYVGTIDITSDIQTQTTTLPEGWTWWSTYIEAEDNDVLTQLETALDTNGLTIKSQNGFVQYSPEYNIWYGSNGFSINNEPCYMIQTEAPCEVEITGSPASPADHPITLNSGWNWIGFPCSTNMNFATAFGSITPTDGDMVKSQAHGFASYIAAYGIWYGTLTDYGIDPGMGLMYKSNNGSPLTFTYPNSRNESETTGHHAENNHWTADYNAYPNNMTVTAVVELNDVELNSDNYELAAFADGECRGSAKLVYVEPVQRYMAFLTIAGEEAVTLNFGLYDSGTDEEYLYAEESLIFETNAIIGNLAEPYIVRFRGTTGVDDWANNLNVFPNPVAHGENISLGLTADEIGEVYVEIINILGMVVETRRATSLHTITAPMVAGVYTLRITVEGKGTCYRKLVVK
jgi:hypothetical protein